MTLAPARLSVIVPARNAAAHLDECLRALLAAAEPGTEIIVVDDASTDGTGAAAEHLGVRVIRLEHRGGPAEARNVGAGQAGGELLFFVDADVVVAPDALRRVARALATDPALAAVFGSYDDHPRARGLVSQYRNLLHHFVHQTSRADAFTFWAGCGAIRRSVFQAVGGFDARRFPEPSIEDIELGYRLRQAGYHIFLDKALQGTHLKRWTMWSVIRTDVVHRAIPWARLILEHRLAPNDLNLRRSQRASVALTCVATLFAVMAPFRIVALAPAGAAVLAVAALNGELLVFLTRRRGRAFAAACVPLLLLFFLYSGLGYAWVWFTALPQRMAAAARRAAGRAEPAGRS